MSKLLYSIHSWAANKHKKITEPFSGGCGAGPALANAFANIAISPITLPVALPFIAIESLTKNTFKKQNKIIVPTPDLESILLFQIGVDKYDFLIYNDIDRISLQFNKIENLFGIKNSSLKWVDSFWDDNSFVNYFILIKGTLPQLMKTDCLLVKLDEVGNFIPMKLSSQIKSIKNNPYKFGHFEDCKFDIKFEE